MGVMQKMMRISIVMFHHAQQRSSIAQPIVSTELAGLIYIQIQSSGKIIRHLTIDLRQDKTRGIMQGVIQVKQVNLAT